MSGRSLVHIIALAAQHHSPYPLFGSNMDKLNPIKLFKSLIGLSIGLELSARQRHLAKGTAVVFDYGGAFWFAGRAIDMR